MTPPLWQKVKRSQKASWWSEREWKSWLKAQHSESEDHGIRSHHFMGNRWGNSGNSVRLYFSGLQNHYRWWPQPWNEKMLAPWRKSYDQPREHIKKQKHYFANKGLSSPSYGFSSSHVWIWKAIWVPKNWCFWTVVLEKTLESPLNCTEIQPVHSKGDQSWVFIGRTNAEAEIPILQAPDAKSWLIWKDPDVGKDWGKDCPTRWTWVDSESWWWHAAVHGVTKSQTWLSNWTELTWTEAPYTSGIMQYLFFCV